MNNASLDNLAITVTVICDRAKIFIDFQTLNSIIFLLHHGHHYICPRGYARPTYGGKTTGINRPHYQTVCELVLNLGPLVQVSCSDF